MSHSYIRFDVTGGPEVLQQISAPTPAPGAGEVLVEHRAIGVNLIDTYHRRGVYAVPLPSRLGPEACGVVAAVGAGVEALAVGQRVAYATGTLGAYATHALQPAAALVPVPDGVSDEQAAAVLLKGMTVDFLVHDSYPVSSGDTVLLHAAAGGVGLLACQWLHSKGATVIGLVSSNARQHWRGRTAPHTRS